MTEIPDDIMQAAADLHYSPSQRQTALALLAERERATMVERERCAKIAQDTAWRGVRTRRFSDIPDEVAAAIRSGGEAGE